MRDDVMDRDATLADLVASRLCHDLVNPLGAIGNGVELLEMTGTSDGPELALIRDAVRAAEARIRYFRLAFGSAREGQTTSIREARGAVEGYFAAGRFTPDFAAGTDLPRMEVKLALLMLLCAETAMPMGGTLRIAPQRRGWQLVGVAPRLLVDDALWSTLRLGPASLDRPISAGEVQFPALLAQAQSLGLSLSHAVDDTTLTLEAL